MICPYCNIQNDKVIDSRLIKNGELIRRRRECLNCEKRYTTFEYIEKIMFSIVKKDGRLERFDRKKLEEGIRLACSKRPVTPENIKNLVDKIVDKLCKLRVKKIPHKTIGKFVMKELKNIDHVAFVRFASVYRKFETKEDFVEVINGIEVEL